MQGIKQGGVISVSQIRSHTAAGQDWMVGQEGRPTVAAVLSARQMQQPRTLPAAFHSPLYWSPSSYITSW